MTQQQRLQHITKENILQAIARIKEEGVPSARESSNYDLVFEGVAYPPKYVTSLAGFFSETGQFILANMFAGGEESVCFAKLRELGFDILPKEETKDLPKPKGADRKMHYKYAYRIIDEELDQELFDQYMQEYIRYCNESTWLTTAEAYKFRFGRWISEHIALEAQSDEEVLALCNESQEQQYDPGSSTKGVNFIVSQKRFQDEFISLVDVQNIRRLRNGELLNDEDLKASPLSFPKFAVWAGVLLPESHMIFGSDELTTGIAHLFHLEDYPKTGVRAFNLANACLTKIKVALIRDYLDEVKSLIGKIFPNTSIQPVDLVWLVQDFILFLNRRILSKTKNYYWVFQGGLHQQEVDSSCIAAPDDNLRHHNILKELKEGDVIVHYWDNAIRATSNVTKEYELKPRPYNVDLGPDLIVGVEYSLLDQPISMDEVSSRFEGKQDLLPKKYGPLTVKLGPAQKYCCEFNEASYKVLFNEPNYWVFQGRPEVFDAAKAIQDENLHTWSVHAHKSKIKEGDKIILWMTGKESGCYALAEVESDLFHTQELAEERAYYANDPGDVTSDKVRIRITHDMTVNPALKDELFKLPAFSDFKGGNQGTNFSATQEQYETILKMSNTDSFSKFLERFPKEDLEAYFKFLTEVLKKNAITFNDQRVVFTYSNDRLNFTVGQRYAWNYYHNNSKGKFGVLSKDELNERSEQFDGNRPRPYYTYFNEFLPSDNEKTNMHEGISYELNRAPVSGHRRHNKVDFEKYAFDLMDGTSQNDDIQHWVYAPGKNAIFWDTFYKDGVMGLGWNDLGDIARFNSRDEITKELQRIEETDSSKKNDSKANWDFLKKIKPGDLVIVNQGRNWLLGYGFVKSDYYYDPTRSDQHHLRKVDWKLKGEWKVDYSVHAKTLTDISWDKIDHPEYDYYHELLLASMGVGVEPKKKEIMAINQISYGPPGTGKTYHLKENLFPRYTTSEEAITKEGFIADLVKDLHWWKVIALAVNDLGAPKVNEIAEHPYIKAKLKTSSVNNVKASIWSHTQAHTVENCAQVNTARKFPPLVFYKNEDSTWKLDESGKEQFEDELNNILEQIENFQSVGKKEIKRYEFITFHQSYSYEDFIEGIKPVMTEESDGDIQYEIKDGIFKTLCKRAENDPENEYAIFIDEINRGNVSSIFGELITLIEPDKRLKAENAMTAILPYSRTSFGVPKNVHIYGTMNTADRSVEALDTALRRRFTFEERMPKPELLEKKVIDGVNLADLLKIINQRIEVLVDRDHTIGHAYLISVNKKADLKNAFKNKIIPLLQEYFYGDYGKIGLVLGEGFVKIEEKNEDIFSSFDYDGRESMTQISYSLKSFEDEDFDFDDALQELLS